MAVQVALRKESVDRNSAVVASVGRVVPSLSARRAWIEMRYARCWAATLSVALRKESVDRNPDCTWDGVTSAESLSARRAWIEMAKTACTTSCATVALRKESVDRNLNSIMIRTPFWRRSPQGERG